MFHLFNAHDLQPIASKCSWLARIRKTWYISSVGFCLAPVWLPPTIRRASFFTADLRVVGFRGKTVEMLFGRLAIKRRLYRNNNGSYRFLLDEALGLGKSQRISPTLAEAIGYEPASLNQ